MREPSRDPSTSSGKLTVLGLLATGAIPFLGFCLWLLLSAGRHVPAAGGGNVPSILSPASGHAQSLYDLSMFVMGVTGAIFAVVYGLLATALVRNRSTEANADREPAQVYGSTQIELAWTIIPILIVVVLFLATARVIHAIQDAPKPPTALSKSPSSGISSGGSSAIPSSASSPPTSCTFR